MYCRKCQVMAIAFCLMLFSRYFGKESVRLAFPCKDGSTGPRPWIGGIHSPLMIYNDSKQTCSYSFSQLTPTHCRPVKLLNAELVLIALCSWRRGLIQNVKTYLWRVFMWLSVEYYFTLLNDKLRSGLYF